MKKLVIVLVALLAACKESFAADTTPVMVSLIDPIQLPSDGYDVAGLRLSLIYGACDDFAGLDIGLINRAAGEFDGLGIGGVNIANGRLCGAQLGLVNWNTHSATLWADRSIGGQVGVLNYCDSFCGLQDGLVNISSGKFTGLQASFLNVASDVRGAQIGSYVILAANFADTITGCQIGLLNFVNRVDGGLQIGLLNINTGNGWLPVLPIVNGTR